MFRPAQPVGVVARIKLRDAAFAPCQPAQARLPFDPRPLAPRDRQQPARPFDHHGSCFVDGRADQRDPLAPGQRQAVNPLRPSPSLAVAAPGQHQPHAPMRPCGGQLPGRRPCLERRVDQQQVRRTTFFEERTLLFRCLRRQQQHLLARNINIHQRRPRPIPSARRISASRVSAALVSTSSVSVRSRSRSLSSLPMIRSHASR